jgi:NACHT domain
MQGREVANRPNLTSYLRTALSFLEKVGEEELKRIPVVGGAVAALRTLSEEVEKQQTDAKLDDILRIGQQTDENVKALTALSAAILHYQENLMEFSRSEGRELAPGAMESVALETALIAYRNRIAYEYSYVDYRGVKGAGRADVIAALPSDELYVIPNLVAKTGADESEEREVALLAKLEDQDLAPGLRESLELQYAEATGKRFRLAEKLNSGVGPMPELLGGHRHAVILGGPGVGKSTSIRFLARTCALGPEVTEARLGWKEDVLPIVISFAAFADARRKDAALSLRDYMERKMLERGGEALRAAVQNTLASGGAFLLLDGIDEVPESSARAMVVRAVDRFRADHASNRMLITSRPVGYVRVAGEIAHFVLPNFSQEQVNEFVTKWQKAQERTLRPKAPDLQRAEKDAQDMVNEIQRNPKVAELATNPLMLVIVALIRREGRRLPDKRVQLYQRAVETLMETWNQFRNVAEEIGGGETLPVDRLTRVWGAVARWTRETRPTGVIHRAELKRKLAVVLEEMEYDENTPEETAEAYLEAAARRAGILEERGTDIFAFWHPTFEEYLAGVDLTTPTSKAVDRLLALADDPRWREVILLGVGYVGIVQSDPETATAIVKALLERPCSDPLEPLLHRRLRLAAACIADDVGVKRKLAEEVIVRLGKVLGELAYRPIEDSFVETVRGTPRIRLSEDGVRDLAHLKGYPNWKVRMEVARLFSNVAASDALAKGLCEELMADSDGDVRCHAALGLARGGELSEQVLLSLAWGVNPYTEITSALSEFLRSAPAEVESAIQQMLELAEEGARDAAQDLVSLREGQPLLRRELKQSRTVAFDARDAALHSEDVDVRLDAFRVLARTGETNPELQEIARSWLQASDVESRLAGAEFLTNERLSIDLASNVLRALLNDSEAEVRLRAAQILISADAGDRQAIETARALLADDRLAYRAGLMLKAGDYRSEVAALFRRWLSTGERVWMDALRPLDDWWISELKTWLEDESAEVRWGALSALAAEGKIDENGVVKVARALSSSAELAERACRNLARRVRPNREEAEALREIFVGHEATSERRWLFRWIDTSANALEPVHAIS